MFEDMVPQLLENVNMVILVYDQCSRESFEKCEKCLDLLRAVSSNEGRALRGVLVGNKYDLVGHVNYDADGDGEVTADEVAAANEKLGKLRQREVSVEEARRWAESRDLTFMERLRCRLGQKLTSPSSGAPTLSTPPTRSDCCRSQASCEAEARDLEPLSLRYNASFTTVIHLHSSFVGVITHNHSTHPNVHRSLARAAELSSEFLAQCNHDSPLLIG